MLCSNENYMKYIIILLYIVLKRNDILKIFITLNIWYTMDISVGGIRMDLYVGDIIKLKKPHPCGSSEWEILRTGMDFRLKCLGCAHQIMIPRKEVEKKIRQVRKP